LALRADAVCGCIEIDDWTTRSEEVRRRFLEGYTQADGHRHVHGANLGVSSHAYRRCGGFQPVAVSEDVALVDALLRCEAKIVWSDTPRVVTSARADVRARGGFGDTLSALVAPIEVRIEQEVPVSTGAVAPCVDAMWPPARLAPAPPSLLGREPEEKRGREPWRESGREVGRPFGRKLGQEAGIPASVTASGETA
jgi:hypothetical protein